MNAVSIQDLARLRASAFLALGTRQALAVIDWRCIWRPA
jgi:hypothetical protein